jgi:hypothetical protein
MFESRMSSSIVIPACLTAPAGESKKHFTDERDYFWDQYLIVATEEDKACLENWRGDTDGILIFVRSAI